MTVGVAGLGLIGGSFVKAYHEAGERVLAWNRTRSVLDFALLEGSADGELNEETIKECDLVITGEGKTDSQTLMGKLPYKISCLAEKYSKKCVIISGSVDGVALGNKMISLVDDIHDTEYAMNNAAELLTEKSKYILQ